MQRQIGFKEEQLGTGQWYEASEKAVGIKKHYKNDCWVSERHIYSMLLWSRGRAYILNPTMGDSDTERIRALIDLPEDHENTEDPKVYPGLGFARGNLSYEDLDDRVPYLTGSFTGWRYRKMIPVHEFCQRIDKNYRDPLKIAYDTDKIKQEVESVDKLNEIELANYKIVAANERKKYRVNWARYFKQYLTYK